MNNQHDSDTFSRFNPILNFTFFIGAVVLTMCFNHPALSICGAVCSAAYLLTVKGTKAFKLIGGMLVLFAAVSLINPVFSTGGDTVLFTYFGGRPYTFEALCYGMCTGGMLFSVMLWFSAYNAVMTSDKFIYIFGRLIPALSLVFTMLLRLVPSYQKRTAQIAGARKCIGKSVAGAARKEKVNNGMQILSVMTTWALEGAVVTADSMRSRGYGTGRRTAFAIYRFDVRDALLLIFMLALIGVIIAAGISGGLSAAFIPSVDIAPVTSAWGLTGLTAFGLFLSIPTMINIKEAILWQHFISKI